VVISFLSSCSDTDLTSPRYYSLHSWTGSTLRLYDTAYLSALEIDRPASGQPYPSERLLSIDRRRIGAWIGTELDDAFALWGS